MAPVGYTTLNGFEIFVVEHHHHVLEAWAKLRAKLVHAPLLITLDFHTDTHAAFQSDYCRQRAGQDTSIAQVEANAAARSKSVDFNDFATVKAAIDQLRNDEHIDCARRSDIILETFILLGRESGEAPGWARVFTATNRHPNDERDRADEILTPAILDMRLDAIEAQIGARLSEVDYILDIDLDVFSTQAAIGPTASQRFHELIRHAGLITIAMETECVEDLRLEGEDITSASLLKDLFTLIEAI